MKTYVILCAALVVVLPFTSYAVCNAPQPRMVCAEYFKEQTTVVAKLSRIKHHVPKNEQDYFVYELRLQKLIRGQIPSTFEIWEENSSGRATFGWRDGESYLLFLSYEKSVHAWVLDGCGNSAPLRKAGPTLRAIERIQKASNGGLVQVVAGLPETKVAVIAGGKRYTRWTDSKGECTIRVPEGNYKVRASRPGWTFSTDDFSYEKPQNVEIHNGSCAQIRLQGLENLK
jgi:hypothetical protein